MQCQQSCVAALDDAFEMVWNGKITDVKTIIGILWVERHYRDSLFWNWYVYRITENPGKTFFDYKFNF